MSARSTCFALHTLCVLLVVCCALDQNINIDNTDLGLNPNDLNVDTFPKEDNSIHAKRVANRRTRVNGKKVVLDDSPVFNIEDDIDLGLRPNPISDWDIKNDVDLGLHHETIRVSPRRRPISDKDIVDDLDLGLTHHSLRKEPVHDESTKKDRGLVVKHEQEKMPISDADLKYDVDLGLHHNSVKEPISDNDIKDDMDMGLKRRGKNTPILDGNLKTDIDFGLKHESTNEPDSYYSDLKNDTDFELKHNRKNENNVDTDINNNFDHGHRSQNRKLVTRKSNEAREFRLQREQMRKEKKAKLIRLKNVNLKSRRHQMVKNDTGQGKTRRRQNSTRPAIPMAQIRRRTLEEMHMTNVELTAMASKSDQIVDNKIHYEEQQESKQENRQQQQKSVLGKGLRGDICHQYDVDGCSIPLGLPFPFKDLFTNSCNRHDICYGCGVEYGFDRSSCDDAFKDNMWKACVTKYGNGKENITDTRKRLIVKMIESLHEKFDDILRLEMDPVMTHVVDPEKDMEKVRNHAKFVQKKVIKKWVNLLREKLYLKKSFSSSNKRKSIDLIYDKELLHVENVSGKNNEHDNNLTTNVCDDILYNSNNDDMVYRMVELSCQEIELLTCHFFDYLYFLAVRVFGSFAYNETPESYCGQAFVKKCLPH